MAERSVTTQAELDAALAAGDFPVLTGDGEFTLPDAVEVAVERSSQPWIVTRGSSQPRIDTRGSSQPRIVTRGSSQPRIDTWGSSQLQARSDHPITVITHGTRTVVTRNALITVEGDGIVIDMPDVDGDPAAWLAHHSVTVADDGTAVLFKRVDNDWMSGRGTRYRPGDTPTAPDWHTRPACGGGLHLSPHPLLTDRYSGGARLVAVRVVAADVVPIPSPGEDAGDKCKVPSCTVLYGCDEDGAEIPVEAVA